MTFSNWLAVNIRFRICLLSYIEKMLFLGFRRSGLQYFPLLFLFSCLISLTAYSQFATAELVDKETEVNSILPTKDGPVYYLAQQKESVFNRRNYTFTIKYFDGYHHYNLADLPKQIPQSPKNELLFYDDQNLLVFHRPEDKGDSSNLYLFNIKERSFRALNHQVEGFRPNAIHLTQNGLFSFSRVIDKGISKFYLYKNGEHKHLFTKQGNFDEIAEHNGLIFAYVKDSVWQVYDYEGNLIKNIGSDDIQIDESKLSKPKLDFNKKYLIEGHLVLNLEHIVPSLQVLDPGTLTFSGYESSTEPYFSKYFIDQQGQFISANLDEDIAVDQEIKNYSANPKGDFYRLDLPLGPMDINSTDFSKNFWYGCKKGLYKVTLKQEYVKTLMAKRSLRKVFPYNDEQLLVGTNSSGVYLLNRTNQKSTPIFRETRERNDYYESTSFFKDSEYNAWGIVLNNLVNYGKDLKQFKRIKSGGGTSFSYVQYLGSDKVLTCNHFKSIWIYNIKSDSGRYLKYPDEYGFFHAHYSINSNEVLLMGERGMFNLNISELTITPVDTINKGILTAYTAPDSSFWLGYVSGKLTQNVWENGKVREIKSYEIGQAVATITQTDSNTFWLGTFGGIAEFKIDEGKSDFLNNNLLSNTECNRFSNFYDAKYDKLYVGTIDGLNVIDLKKYKSANNPYQLYFSSVRHSKGKESELETEVLVMADDLKLELPANNRTCLLRFAATSSIEDPNLNFEFRIDEGEWQDNLDNSEILFPYFEAGTHLVEVRAVNSRNVPADNILKAEIVAKPFFFETAWFKITLALLTLGFAFYWYRRITSENIRLETTVKERTEELEKDKKLIEEQADQLKELDGLKNQFFANISHELRTPLTLILSPLKTLLRDKEQKVKSRKNLEIIAQNAEILEERVGELLELSRLTSGKVKLANQNVYLPDLVGMSTKIFETEAAQKDLKFQVNANFDQKNIFSDQNRLNKVLQNLISNAIKFTPRGGEIIVNVRSSEGQLHFSVKDTGIGISEENQKRIYERFYQVKADNTLANPGTGIGLAMVKEYVNMMNGEIFLESHFGKGTSVTVTLPVKPAPESVKEPIIAEKAFKLYPKTLPDRKPRLLIVEDNAGLRSYLKNVLEDRFELSLAENGQVAIEILAEKPNIEIILSDIMMPEKDGITLLDEVRSNSATRLLPFVFLTAKYNEETKLQAFRIGVDDYLTKPFDEVELIHRLAAVYKNYFNRVNARLEVNKEEVFIIPDDFASKLEHLVLSNLSKNDFSTEFLAEQFNLSRRQFIRNVKQEIGLNPKDYIKEIRLNKARQIYQSGDFETVDSIAQQVGLSGGWYFSKLYFERFGTELK